MSESEITDVYNKMLEDLVRLCRILLNYQMIHGVDAEDIVQRVVLRALEKKEQLANHKNLYGWFVNACKLECITLRVAPASNAGGWVYRSRWNRKSSSRNNRTNSSNGCERAR